MKVAYRTAPFTMRRRMAAASADAGRKHSTIHGITEVDITEPRRRTCGFRKFWPVFSGNSGRILADTFPAVKLKIARAI